MKIHINGAPETFDQESSIETLLLSKNIDPACVVVELNRTVVKKEYFGSTKLKDGDVLEILRFVGGG